MPFRSKRAKRPPRVPSYCLHRASGQAYVKVGGKVTYLGVCDSDASRAAYAAVVASVVSGRGVEASTAPVSPSVPTVRMVCAGSLSTPASTWSRAV